MNSKEIDLIRKATEEQIEMIKYIINVHPGYYADTKYAYYVGGMTDTGGWFIDVLLSAHIDDLRGFFKKIKQDDLKRAEESTKRKKEIEVVEKMSEEEKASFYRKQMSEEFEAQRHFIEKLEQDLMWGNGR